MYGRPMSAHRERRVASFRIIRFAWPRGSSFSWSSSSGGGYRAVPNRAGVGHSRQRNPGPQGSTTLVDEAVPSLRAANSVTRPSAPIRRNRRPGQGLGEVSNWSINSNTPPRPGTKRWSNGNASSDMYRALLERSSEPIAIVGMSCRFPGGIDSPEALWQMVADGRDVMSTSPRSIVAGTWPGCSTPDPDARHKRYARTGGFVDGVADFDPGENRHRARARLWRWHPQHRMPPELAWEALERAGIYHLFRLRGSATGVRRPIVQEDEMPLPKDWIKDDLLTAGITLERGNRGGGRTPARVGGPGGVGGYGVFVVVGGAAHGGAVTALGRECDLALAGGATVHAMPTVSVGLSGHGAVLGGLWPVRGEQRGGHGCVGARPGLQHRAGAQRAALGCASGWGIRCGWWRVVRAVDQGMGRSSRVDGA